MSTTAKALTLGEALREARIKAGFARQLDAANASPYRERDFSRWESGAAEPRANVIVVLTRLYAPHLDLSRVRAKGRFLSSLDDDAPQAA